MLAISEHHTHVGRVDVGDLFYMDPAQAIYQVVGPNPEADELTMCRIVAWFAHDLGRYHWLIGEQDNANPQLSHISDNTPCVQLTFTEQPA